MERDLTIIKIGTGVLTRDTDGQLDRASLLHLVAAVAQLVIVGHRCVMVSSGAVGAGISGLGLDAYPSDVPTRQACASIGQTRLMHHYQSLFQNFDLDVAQLLLTAYDFENTERSQRVSDTLSKLLSVPNIVPIINENDSVVVDEISFGDNDMLSARVASLLGVKQLILLTSVDGLYPSEGSEIVDQVTDVESVLDFARADSGKFSIGGMRSKLTAVQYAVEHGVETIIANGRNPQNIPALVAGKGIGTRFKIS